MNAVFLLSTLVGLISCAHFTELDPEFTFSLLSNLNDKYNGIKPTQVPAPLISPVVMEIDSDGTIRTIPLSFLERIDLYLLGNIFDYLNYFDGNVFMQLSHTCNYAGKITIRQRISNFSPYCLFRNDWLNHLMMCHLRAVFPLNAKLEDDFIRDIYHEFYLKRFRLEKDYIFSSTVEYKFQSFIHEILYGSQDIMPDSSTRWTLSFFTKLSKQEHDYSRSLNYYINTVEKELNEVSCAEEIKQDSIKLLHLYIDLYNGPLTDERFQERSAEIVRLENLLEINLSNIDYYLEFKLLNDTNFHRFRVADMQLKQTWDIIIQNGLFSNSLLHRLPEEFINELLSKSNYLQNRSLFPEICQQNGRIPDILKLLIHNPTAPVGTDRLTVGMMKIIGVVSSPNLNLIDMFSRAIRANLHDFTTIHSFKSSLFLLFYHFGHEILFDGFVIEVRTGINTFVYLQNGVLIKNIFNLTTMNSYNFKFHYYVSYLLTFCNCNPLPLIFVNFELLELCQESIRDKFNLNYRYKINFNLNRIDLESTPYLRWLIPYQKQILTFKQIIDILAVDGLINIFTSNPSTFGSLSDESSRIFSLHDYITSAVL